MRIKKKTAFTLALIAIPVLFFVMLELCLMVFNYGGSIRLFVSGRGDLARYDWVNPYVCRRFFSTFKMPPDPPNDTFRKVKPDNGFRIFVLGGSTTAGYPYGNNVMFTRILERRLADTFPEKTIEMINVATSAINTHALLDFTDEILHKEPDAILIYAGHNEYYGALGVASTERLGRVRGIVRVYLKFVRLKTFRLLRDAIGGLGSLVNKILKRESLTDPTATLMERLVSEQSIVYDSPLYEAGKRQFKTNLHAILQKAEKAGVPVVLSELVSNVRDQEPFVSVGTMKNPPADSVFQRARSLEREGEYAAAQKAYTLAKDLDALRFRASEEFNAIIHDVASEYNAPVVPMKAAFKNASPFGLVGHTLMHEHLHPNIDGYFLMADAFYETMKKQRMISVRWNPDRIRPSTHYRKIWGFTKLDSIYADIRIRILKGGWPFMPKAAPNRFLRDFRPQSRAEALVINIWKDQAYTIESAHMKQADYFREAEMYDLAYEEFKAMIYLSPWNVSPYLGAAEMLIHMRQLSAALPLLRRSLRVEETFYAKKWIGQILLDQGEVVEAMKYLEKAFAERSDDAQLLYNLSGGYAIQNKFEKAWEMMEALDKVDPDFPDADDLKRQLAQILNKQ